jgi:maltose/moltooligosaccharide transporter
MTSAQEPVRARPAPQEPSRASPTRRERKPLLTTTQILVMNFGFLGIQYSFGMQQTAVNPIFGFLHADTAFLPLLNLAGPVTGLLLQPMIGALSDRTWSPRWGRRKPFFVIGAIGCSVCLFLFPFVTALWMAVLLLWLLDASNNTAMEPYRAFIADKLPESQLARGFLTQSFFTGLGVTLANFSLFFFQKLIVGGTQAGIPYWVFGSFMLGSVVSIASVLISVLRTPEIPPTDEELAELRAQKGGVLSAFTDIFHAVKDIPPSLHQIGVVYLFQWYAMVVYWQFVSFAIAKNVFHTTAANEGQFSKAVGLTGLVNGSYSLVAFLSAFALIGFAKRYGAKWVHAVCLGLAGLGLVIFAQISNEYLIFLPIIGLGIAWASMMGVPYILIVSMVPKERYGVYMGIVNMMIVVPMLIQSFTFTFVYTRFLGSDPSNAIVFAGAFLLLAGLLMLWIRSPKADEESDIMPLSSARRLRELHLERTIDGPLGPVVSALRAGPQEWLPDFREESGQPTTELRVDEAGQRVVRRVRLSLGTVQPSDRAVTVSVRWEAAQSPQLYPRLDGVLRIEEQDGHCLVRFDARYLPPAGRLGAAVDRVLMGRVARASVGDFFDRLTARLDRAAHATA